MAERAIGRQGLRAMFFAAALAATLVLVAPAWGAKVIYPNTPTAQFGPDGTNATELNGSSLAFDSARKRLYAFGTESNESPYELHAFDTPTPGTHSPLGPGSGFPINFGFEYPGNVGMAADSLSGNVYLSLGSRGTASGWTSAGVALTGGFPLGPFEGPCGVATDAEGHVWVVDGNVNTAFEYDASGHSLGSLDVSDSQPCLIAIDGSNDDMYVAKRFGKEIFKYQRTPSGYTTSGTPFATVESPFSSIQQLTVDPVTHNVFAVTEASVTEFAGDGGAIDEFGTGGETLRAMTEDPNTNTVYVVTFSKILAFEPLVTPDVTATPPTDVTTNSATLTGHIDTSGAGDITGCQFEWGPVGVAGYPNQVPCSPSASPGSPITGAQDVTAEINALNKGTAYHYQLNATNANGTTRSNAITLQTLDAPSVNSLYTSDLSPTTAVLHTAINPRGADTTYHFEYGTTTNYDTSIPIPDADVGSSYSDQDLSVQVTGLTEHAVYHFRVVATNEVGTTVSGDQTFNFFPESCPNAAVRQQTGSEYLPDCRAYELVSPEDAGNVVLFDQGLPTPYASNPARFTFGGVLGGVKGTDPPNSLLTDIYVTTRTSSGWDTSYVGIPGSETGGSVLEMGSLSMNQLMSSTTLNAPGVPQPPDNLPQIYNAEGKPFGRWPGNWAVIPGAKASKGDYQPSPDFSHMAFSSNNVAFAPNGLTKAPGSAYDYDPATGSTTIISKTPGGADIAQEPGAAGGFPEEFIIFPDTSPNTYGATAINPGVSTDGSHILMATLSEPEPFLFPPLAPQHLYMRVNDMITYDVAKGHDVEYAGMTADGSQVYFTSPEQLTEEDTDHSVDLYMWSEKGDKLTLLSAGAGGAGNGDSCNAGWTSACNVKPVEGFANSDNSISSFLSDTDYPIATSAGDFYFYSPEQLDGSKGLPGAENLYVYREGAPHFVVAFTDPPAETCLPGSTPGFTCSNGPIGRIEVSPDGRHMAFVTASRVTSYDNAGFQEMYTYDPAGDEILCVSCQPDGSPPTADVQASYTGLFMTNEGRTFFATTDALVSQDTNGLNDVYEYVSGRPQLITSGTAEQDTNGGRAVRTGLDGVSADGVNVYFSTFDSLVPQDHNGPFRKFYDARVNGGFLVNEPAAPCEAADECHGVGSSQPADPPVFSDGSLGAGGNHSPQTSHGRKAHQKKKKTKKHHQRNRRRHGKRAGGQAHG
jgi:hypothetical protein